MKKNNIKITIITTIVCLLPMIMGAIMYQQIPEQIPNHYGINSAPNQYVSKDYMLFGLPIIMAVTQLICCFIFFIFYGKNIKKMPKIVSIVEWFIPILTIGIYFIILQGALGMTKLIAQSIGLVIGILVFLIGNYIPKISYEDSLKIFHPILADEKSFRRYARIMGYSFALIGILAILISFITLIKAMV